MKKVPLIVVLGSILIAAVVQAAITVTNLNDSGPGSLRQAIADAAPGDTINFAVTGTIVLTSGELVITNDLTISGPGAKNLTVSGNNSSRVFSIFNATGSISSLAASNGRAFAGGALYVDSTSTLIISNCSITASEAFFSEGGGGVENVGTLTIIDSTISRNTSAGRGGGIVNSGALTATNCTIEGNTAYSGGGVFNLANLTVMNSTISSNAASGGGGIVEVGFSANIANCTVSGNRGTSGSGGGILTDRTVNITNSTITSNYAYQDGGGVYSFSGAYPVNIRNSIISGNTTAGGGPDCGGVVNSQDYNLIQNTNGCTIIGISTHNIYNQDPLLGPLQDNGGPTPTHALLPGSPAIDAGQSGGLATDQRGFPRPVDNAGVVNASGGDGSDIGAYEACAETNLVTNTNDSGPGSLRQAILAANACAGQNTIEFAPSAYGTITLTSGQLVIDRDLTISGPGATNMTVSGNDASRVLEITSGTVNVSGLTVSHGQELSSAPHGGGAILNWGTTTIIGSSISSNRIQRVNNIPGYGGGIQNQGAMTISNSVIVANSCDTAYGQGGGVYNAGLLTVINSSISTNSGTFGSGFANSGTATFISATVSENEGAGIGSIYNYGFLAATNTTVSGNRNLVLGGTGGGIRSDAGSVSLDSCTVSSNFTYIGGGIDVEPSSDIYVRNSIIAGNYATYYPDAVGTLNSEGYNLIQDTNGCTITGITTHNIYNQDPLLGPLADNGGPTWTHALLTGSPAIGAGDPNFTSPPDFDQRGPGFPRVVSGRIDIGAFEYVYVCPGDADCDGIPDSWMYQYFGHATGQAPDKSRATDDADGDGQSNLAEFQAGTSPTNGTSTFRIIEIALLDEDVLLTWTTVGGKKYAVQTVTGGYTSNFVELSPVIIAPGTGESLLSFIYPGGATNVPARFYRIRLVP